MSQAEVVVVTCVIDSSLALAAEWPQILSDYIVPLLQRLGEHQFRMSFVGYGTADARPTPVVHKTFFIQPNLLLVKMREHPQELGIGQTGSGGGYGMAALEGLVAALEVRQLPSLIMDEMSWGFWRWRTRMWCSTFYLLASDGVVVVRRAVQLLENLCATGRVVQRTVGQINAALRMITRSFPKLNLRIVASSYTPAYVDSRHSVSYWVNSGDGRAVRVETLYGCVGRSRLDCPSSLLVR